MPSITTRPVTTFLALLTAALLGACGGDSGGNTSS